MHRIVRGYDMQQLTATPQLFIKQQKEWAEILVDFETANRYEIMDANKQKVGMIAERGGGFMRTIQRMVLRSHRPLEIDVFDMQQNAILHFARSFFFFFSDLHVTAGGQSLGSVHRRFGIIYKKYDLIDETGAVFARISAPLWRIWTFPLINSAGATVGEISKKWSGLLAEVFTDADSFLVNYGEESWTHSQRAVILAAAISIDFDFFEDNN